MVSMAAASFSYDAVEYPGYPRPQTHPDRLATIASLFGMEPAPVAHCRMLELGCGDGGNLVPMALSLPESEFVGIDLGETAIRKAQSLAAELGLRNIAFRREDILEMAADYGEFDYIAAHGVYSWVPAAVRNHMLRVIQGSLAPQGVAYISYNTLPGWHLRQMTRDMMLYHLRGSSDPRERIDRAREFLGFAKESALGDEETRSLLKRLCDRLLELREGYLYHDELETTNEPCYFAQFAAHVRENGLEYLAPAKFEQMQVDLPAAAAARVEEYSGGDRIVWEQYLDFLMLRVYRESLLCRQEALAGLALQPDRVRSMYVSSAATSEDEHTFHTPKRATISVQDGFVKQALTTLMAAWPRSMTFDELAQTVRTDEKQMIDALLRLAVVSAVYLRTHPPHCASAVSERPTASPLARIQARTATQVTNLLHSLVGVEDRLAARLLIATDGTRDRTALLDELRRDDPLVPAESLDHNIEKMRRLALLWA